MASTTCGYCGRLAYMKAASGLHLIPDSWGSGGTLQAVYKCPNCLRLNTASEHAREVVVSSGDIFPEQTAEDHQWGRPTWLPVRGQWGEFEDVPEHIARAASEATLCMSVGAYRAVGSLARAVVEAIAKDKQVFAGTLASKIDGLPDLRRYTKEQAHEVRHFGNGMAHGDFTEDTTEEEAEEVLALMAEILDEVYQSPARLDRLKAARLAKRAEKD